MDRPQVMTGRHLSSTLGKIDRSLAPRSARPAGSRDSTLTPCRPRAISKTFIMSQIPAFARYLEALSRLAKRYHRTMEQRESILLIGGISMGFPKLGNRRADGTLPLEIHLSVVNTRLK